MITNLLPELMAQRGISIRQLSRDTDITYSTIWALVHSQRRSVQLEVLDAVCAALDVQPGDIYQRAPSGEQRPVIHEQSSTPRQKRETATRPAQQARKGARNEWRSW